MTDDKLKKANYLSEKIDNLKRDIRFLSEPNCALYSIDIKQSFGAHPRTLQSTIFLDSKQSIQYLLFVFGEKLIQLEKEYELL